MIERAAGGEHERILRIGLLDRRLILDREELPLAIRARRLTRVEVGRPGVIPVGARPLHTALLQPVVADPVPVGREIGELVPDRLRVRVLGPLGAERPR